MQLSQNVNEVYLGESMERPGDSASASLTCRVWVFLCHSLATAGIGHGANGTAAFNVTKIIDGDLDPAPPLWCHLHA